MDLAKPLKKILEFMDALENKTENLKSFISRPEKK